MTRARFWISGAVAALAVAVPALLGAAILFGGPTAPPPMASINDPFRTVDWRGLPQPYRWPAGADEGVAVRAYPASGPRAQGIEPVALLIHGSAGAGPSMHALAGALAAGGVAAYAMDIRGHGDTGMRGDVDRPGRIEDDVAALADHVRARHPGARLALVGFSLGGGYALKVAAGAQGDRFDGYVLLAPLLGRDAPATKPAAGLWVGIGLPRIVALSLLDRAGLPWLQDRPVLAFAVRPDSPHVTATYSFRLFREFGPPADYLAALRAVRRPLALLVGAADELFHADRFDQTVAPARPELRTTIVPETDHIGLIVQPAATAAVRAAVLRVLSSAP